MRINKMYLVLGVVFLIIAISFFLFDKNNTYGLDLLSTNKYKTITAFDNYKLDIPSYMKETNKGDLTVGNNLEYENLIREIFINFEQLPGQESVNKDSISEDVLFAELILQKRAFFGRSIVTDNDTVEKKLSSTETIDLEDIQCAWFSMEMEGINNSSATYYVFAIYKDGNQFYILSIATNLAYKDTYSDSFIKIINSFKRLSLI